jgi:hypothetical protein
VEVQDIRTEAFNFVAVPVERLMEIQEFVVVWFFCPRQWSVTQLTLL